MAKLYANPRDVAIRVKAKSRLKTSGGVGGKATLLPKNKSTSQFFLFVLLADMVGAYASATVTMMDGTAVGTFNVQNTLSDFSHLLTGDAGMCVKVKDKYYVVHPEYRAAATGVTVTLTSDMAGTVAATATATVDVSGDPDVSNGDTLTVYNTTTKKAYSGAKSWAIKINNVWWLAEVDQYALLSTATLSSATHDVSSGYSNNGSVARKQTTTVSALVAISSYPQSFIPGTLPNLDNPRNLIGLSGDKATVAYNRTNDKWEILEIHPATARVARIKLTSAWPAGVDATSSSFSVVANESEVGGDIPTIASVKDVNSLAMNAGTNDTGIVRYNYVSEGWELVSIMHQATLWRGSLASSFSGTPTTFTVDCEAAYNGYPPSGTQTVQNIYGWGSGTSGKKVAVAWNPIDEQWEPLQMGCP